MTNKVSLYIEYNITTNFISQVVFDIFNESVIIKINTYMEDTYVTL